MADDHDGHDGRGEILLGCWDCAACGAQRQRGDAYQCASCGAPRPENVAFYLPAAAEVVTDPEGVRAAESGPDWQCAFCQSWMPATETVCRNCRAPVEASERRHETRTYEPGQAPEPGRQATPTHEVDSGSRPQGMTHLLPDLHSVMRRYRVVTIIAIALLGVAAVIYGVNLAGRRHAYQQEVAVERGLVDAVQQRVDEASRELRDAELRLSLAQQAVARAQSEAATAEDRVRQLREEQQFVERAPRVRVAAHSWTVRLEIEQCVAREGEGWNYPPDAFDVRSEQRIHHHEKVLDHVETLFRTETYRAQEGFETETYTERVAAGTRRVQDGYETEDLGNGRFRRTPRYRTETVYENVVRTRQKPRMVTKTRQVPYENRVYRQDPVHKPWYTYRTKLWTPAPAMSRSGEGLDVRDPEGHPSQDPGSELGARRIRSRLVSYALALQPIAGAGQSCTIVVPDARWRSFADGSTGLLAKNEILSHDEQQARLSSLRDRMEQATKQLEELRAKVAPLVERLDPLREQVPPLRQTLAKTQAELSEATRRLEDVVSRGY